MFNQLICQTRTPDSSLKLVCRHGRDDLVDTVVAPASAEAAASAVSDIREERERVAKYLTRLKEVRHKRSAMEVLSACLFVCWQNSSVHDRTDP